MSILTSYIHRHDNTILNNASQYTTNSSKGIIKNRITAYGPLCMSYMCFLSQVSVFVYKQ